MSFLIKTGYLIGTIIISFYLYIWAAGFKRLGQTSMEEFNEEEEKEEDLVNETETRWLNHFGKTIFLLLGLLIWALVAITVGRIASEVTENAVLKWFVYIGMYFFFLRFPFGVANKSVVKAYGFEHFLQKIPFALTMIACYIVSICCYDVLPNFLKWHLMFLP
ncbi:MAG: hypothetical protein AB8B69_08430 [Chitinophagales bacterium]